MGLQRKRKHSFDIIFMILLTVTRLSLQQSWSRTRATIDPIGLMQAYVSLKAHISSQKTTHAIDVTPATTTMDIMELKNMSVTHTEESRQLLTDVAAEELPNIISTRSVLDGTTVHSKLLNEEEEEKKENPFPKPKPYRLIGFLNYLLNGSDPKETTKTTLDLMTDEAGSSTTEDPVKSFIEHIKNKLKGSAITVDPGLAETSSSNMQTTSENTEENTTTPKEDVTTSTDTSDDTTSREHIITSTPITKLYTEGILPSEDLKSLLALLPNSTYRDITEWILREHTLVKPDNSDNVVVGDMVLGIDQHFGLFADMVQNNKAEGNVHIWPNEADIPTIPYSISHQDPGFFQVVRRGIEEWQKQTCLKFRERKDGDEIFLNFIHGEGCWSFIGFATKSQNLSLGVGCLSEKVATHLIGHALGLVHQNIRSDRDEHISVNFRNVDNNTYDLSFNKLSRINYVNYSVPYDISSVMHEHSRAYALNGGLTMKTLNPMYEGVLNRQEKPSHRDKLLINKMYGCHEIWQKDCKLTDDHCANGGFIGSDCRCICAPGTSGDKCQTVLGDYYGDLLSNCSMTITQHNTTIKTPGYPNIIPKNTWCVYYIIAPQDEIIQVLFSDFLLEEYPIGQFRCFISSLTIMANASDYTSSDIQVCGRDYQRGYIYNSTGNKLVMYLETTSFSSAAKGFDALVLFRGKDNLSSVSYTASTAVSPRICLHIYFVVCFIILSVTDMKRSLFF